MEDWPGRIEASRFVREKVEPDDEDDVADGLPLWPVELEEDAFVFALIPIGVEPMR